MPEPIYEEPCSKCGRYLVRGEKSDRLGDLKDHRVCVVPADVEIRRQGND